MQLDETAIFMFISGAIAVKQQNMHNCTNGLFFEIDCMEYQIQRLLLQVINI